MRLDRELACIDIVELVTAYLEDALEPADRERFEEHLVFCDGCGTYLEQMRQTIAALGRLELDGLPEELEAQLLDAFREWRSA
jgi:anti-sigma factor RsiW